MSRCRNVPWRNRGVPAAHRPQGSRSPTITSRRAGIIGICLLLVVPALPAGADGHVEAQRRREELRQQRTAAAADVDVLAASRQEVESALDALEANAAAEQALLDDANRRVEQTTAAAALARTEAERMEREVLRLQGAVRDLAVEEFVGGERSASAPSLMLDAGSAGEAGKVVYLAGLEVGRQDEYVDELEQVTQDLVLQRRAAERAEAQAVEDRAAVAARVEEVERARDVQAAFVGEVEAEFERKLAEAAALEQLDQQLAAEIVRGEQALADRLAVEAARVAEARARQAATAAARRLAPRSEGARSGSSASAGEMVSVRGIVVHRSIADDLEELLRAADADGVSFSGGGYRDSAQQQRLREQNCPDPDRSPASSCRPPTARPGQSMHEQGLAIDFTYGGRVISSRSSPGFRWLDANAGRFGLANLPSEPWHWSTNGK